MPLTRLTVGPLLDPVLHLANVGHPHHRSARLADDGLPDLVEVLELAVAANQSLYVALVEIAGRLVDVLTPQRGPPTSLTPRLSDSSFLAVEVDLDLAANRSTQPHVTHSLQLLQLRHDLGLGTPGRLDRQPVALGSLLLPLQCQVDDRRVTLVVNAGSRVPRPRRAAAAGPAAPPAACR